MPGVSYRTSGGKMIETMIVTKDLSKRYPVHSSWIGKTVGRIRGVSEDKPPLALDKLNIAVKKGDIYGFLGPNGAGKTTTIKILTGITPPTLGAARVCGYDTVRESAKLQKRIGYMPEIPAFYPRVDVFTLLRYFGRLHGLPGGSLDERIESVLSTVGLSKESGKKIGKLSFGMKKRLSLGQAILHRPELLILDEPTGGLDPGGKKDFRDLLAKLGKKDITIFMSSHLLSEVQKICTSVGILSEGRLIASDSIEELGKKLRERSEVKIEIEVSSADAIPSGEIGKIGGVEKVIKEGNTITIFASDEKASSRVNELLVKSNCSVRSLVIEEPALEDIFRYHIESEEE